MDYMLEINIQYEGKATHSDDSAERIPISKREV